MLKRILSTSIVQWVIAGIIAAYMVLVRITTRWTVFGLENAQTIWESQSGLVLCYWHSRIIMAPSFWPKPPMGQKILMLVSQSRDGQPVSRASEMVGFKTIRGSSTRHRADITKDKGALQAVRSMINHAKNGGAAAITPDGPRGPRMRVQQGTTRIAKSANVPMLPISIAVRGSKYLKSWDRFVLPALFSKGVIIYGKPFTYGDKAEEDVRLELEAELNEITIRADEWAGAPQILPAKIDASEIIE